MRYLKKYIRKLYHLIWFLGSFLLFCPNVFAIPTGEIYSETTSSNITLLSKFQYADGEVRLYGRSGSGQSSPFIPSLNEFRDGNYSLFTYQQIPSGNRTSFGMNFYLDKTLMSGKSYTSTFKVSGNPSTVEYYFSNPYSITNANLNSKSITCLTGSCFINTTFTMSNSTNQLHIDFTPTEGLNGQIFVDIFTGIFMAQVEEYNYLDTSGLQNNQQIIINQNDTIINNNNQNTQDIINNYNQNTQDIINSSGSNTQSIIDNQNENSEKEIESQKVCRYIDKSNISLDNKYLSINGEVYNTNGVGITNYININSSTIEVLDSVTGSANSCFYNSNKELISCVNLSNTSGTITIPNRSQYFRATISKSQNKPTFNICQNGNQALNDSVNGLNDTLNDSSIDSSDNTINNLKNHIPTNSVISDLLLLPVRFLQNFVNALGSSCSQFNLGSLYGTNLYMPCINVESYLGSAIWTAIDLIISGMFVYVLRKKFIEIYENLTNLKNGGNEVD